VIFNFLREGTALKSMSDAVSKYDIVFLFVKWKGKALSLKVKSLHPKIAKVPPFGA
jgi:hypothetical protein